MQQFKKILSLHFILTCTLLAYSPTAYSFNFFSLFSKNTIVYNANKISATPVDAILIPESVTQLRNIVLTAKKPIAIAGARFSQGGQIAYSEGTVIDMKKLNAIINLDVTKKEVTVQSGCTWIELLRFLDHYNLSVKVMQSYADFSIGGALSVNCHGRHMHNDPLITTVQSIEIMLADGTLAKASRSENSDLFYGAIGGYGALGIITQATFTVTDNIHLERRTQKMSSEEYPDFFFAYIANDPTAQMHSAFLYPNNFDSVLSVTYHTTDKPVTIAHRLQNQKGPFIKELLGIQALARIPGMKDLRPKIDNMLFKDGCVEYRNYELSYTTKSLDMFINYPTTYILQEYFIPIKNIGSFLKQLRFIVNNYDINVINATLRFVGAHTESIMTYAPQDCFAVVLYLNIPNNTYDMKETTQWTQLIINAAIQCHGTYYLPYQLCGTREQFSRCYPGFKQLMEIKKIYDPENVLSNTLLKKYG